MEEQETLVNGQSPDYWRKSSRSGTGDDQGGGNCIEVGVIGGGMDWFANA